MKYLFFIFSLFTFLFSQDIEDPDSLLESDDFVLEVVVTATRSEKPLAKSPASVSVISQEDIKKSPAKNVDDLLKRAMGVQMKRVTGFGEGIPSDIIVRGIPGALAASRTLLLIDGVPTNSGGTPSFIMNEVSLQAIERIEIVRGPYSSLYGSNAFGGVINIITKKGEGRPSLNTVFETTWPFSVAHEAARDNANYVKDGSKNAYYGVNGTFSGEVAKVNYIIDGGYRTVGNYLMADTAFEKGPHGTIYKDPRNHDYRDVKVFGKMGVDINDKLDLSIQSRFFNSDLGFGLTKNLEGDSLDIIMAGQKVLVGPSLNWKISDKTSFLFSGYFQRLIGEYWNEEPAEPFSIPSYWKSTADELMFNISNNVSIGEIQTITSGVSAIYNDFNFGEKINHVTGDTLDRSNPVDADAYNLAIFLQDEIKYKEKLLIVPGIRVDYHSVFDFSLSPKLSALCAFNDLFRIRGSLGRAFRAPNLAEYAMPDFSIDPSYSLKSNRDLKPEKVWAYDWAGVFSYKKWIELDVGGFYNNMTDLVGQGMVIPKDSVGNYLIDDAYLTHQNISDAWSAGLEISLISKPTDWLIVEGNVVVQNSRNETLKKEYLEYYRDEDSANLFDYSLDYIPHVNGGFNITFQKELKNFEISSDISWLATGKRFVRDLNLVEDSDIYIIPKEDYGVHILPKPIELEPYFTTDLSFRVDYKKRFSISLLFLNIFNEAYEESSGTGGTGRFATIKIGVNI